MRIAIVDDIAAERNLLHTRLNYKLKQHSIQADVLEYESGEAFLADAEQQPFTVVFLDIYMDGMSGMEAAKALRKLDTDCLLIFTTTSTDHALEGFQVRAMHYLVKPYTEQDLTALIDEILSRIPQPDNYLAVKVSGSDIQLPFKEMLYAEHFSHMIHVHTTGNLVLTTRMSFGQFTAPLKEDDRFFLCSRGIVINMEHAIDFDGTAFLLDNGSSIPVSRDLIKTARQTFMNFLFQRGH